MPSGNKTSLVWKKPRFGSVSWVRISGKVQALSFVAVVAVIGSAYVLHSRAAVSDPLYLCNIASSFCASPGDNAATVGSPLIAADLSTGAGRWRTVNVGKVGTTKPNPFRNLYFNQAYYGDTVFQFQLASNSALCITAASFDAAVHTSPCDAAGADWVLSGHRLINVYATNTAPSSTTTQVLTGNPSAGGPITVTSPGTVHSPGDQNWYFRP